MYHRNKETDCIVVVHAEMSYLEPRLVGEKNVRLYDALFRQIGAEVERYIEAGRQAYFLGWRSRSADSTDIPPAIREHMASMTYIAPTGPLEPQFLATKELLMDRGIDHVAIAGVAAQWCVQTLFELLTGEYGDGQKGHDFEWGSHLLQWQRDRFHQVAQYRMDAVISDNLTDKVFDFWEPRTPQRH